MAKAPESPRTSSQGLLRKAICPLPLSRATSTTTKPIRKRALAECQALRCDEA